LEAFVDTHCHLNFNLFEPDLDQVLERAWEHGIQSILMPGIDVESSRQVVALAERHPNLFAAVGVHPNDARSWNEQTERELRELAQHPRVLAIGEIGLDYYRDRAPAGLQRQVLETQISLAAELGKPVVLHSRDSIHDLWPILSQWQMSLAQAKSALARRPGVFHSYDGDLDTASKIIAQGFFIGISGPVTFRNATLRQGLVAALPLENLLLETDAPFLTPHPLRGKRNEPSYIPLIAEKIAELHAQPLPVVAEITTRNANRLLGWRSDR
jgi:TatD DNase family protein